MPKLTENNIVLAIVGIFLIIYLIQNCILNGILWGILTTVFAVGIAAGFVFLIKKIMERIGRE